ncbi:carbohydrate ABC transporter permease [Streptosporangium sp. KLBMP 9127]|nr:sugar ABC transporter permease [Streptosporangium sp. KLBMP 9127]
MTQTTLTKGPARRGAGPRRAVAGPAPGRSDARAGYLFLSPWIIGMAVLTLGPMLASLYLSFTNYNLFNTPDWIGLENYRKMFADDQFHQTVSVTLRYVLLATPLKLGAALAVAIWLTQSRRAMGLYRTAFYAPSLLGASVAMAIVWRALFADDGVQDQLTSSVGLGIGGWVGNPDYSLLMLVLLAVWQFGAPMVIFLAGLQQVPRELYEAAEVDGAGRWRRFVSVTLPMISPVIFFNLLLETVHAFQVFTSAYVISGGDGGPAGSTLFYTLHLYQRAFSDYRMGYASAMAWVLLIVVGLVTALLFRTSRAWVHYAGGSR